MKFENFLIFSQCNNFEFFKDKLVLVFVHIFTEGENISHFFQDLSKIP